MMHAYRLCDVHYGMKKTNRHIRGGKGSLWMTGDAILIKKDGTWVRLPTRRITGARMERKILRIFMKDNISVDVNSNNDYIIQALYHYIEGAIWQKMWRE